MDIIKALKENVRPFCKMHGDETVNCVMQENLRTIVAHDGVESAEFLDENGLWRAIVNNDFALNRVYRLRADYQQDKYELCEIFVKEANSLCYKQQGAGEIYITDAVRRQNFAGYLYEDGKVSAKTRRYEATGNGTIYPDLPIGWFNAGTVIVLRPTHVVFRKH